MLKFEPSKLIVKYEMMSSISPALGGSIRLATYETVIDEETKEPFEKEIITRLEIPFKVARAWKEQYKVSKYMVPIPVAVVYYDDMVVMVEKGPDIPAYMLEDPEKYGSLFDKNKLFTAHVEGTVAYIQKVATDLWCTDGTMMYQMPHDLNVAFEKGLRLTADGVFRSHQVPTISFSELMLKANVENPTDHTIVMIKMSETSKVFATPPIFKNIAEMRNSKLTTDEGKNDDYRFDLIEKMFNVNMEFALNSGKTVGSIFGNKAVSPLGLPQLMIALTTVNLPKIRTSVRSTFPMGMSFLQAYAWLTGLMDRVDTLEDMIKMRGVMKFLCQKGIFKKNTMDKVFRKTSTGKDKIVVPKLLSREQLQTHVDNQSDTERLLTVDKILRNKKNESADKTANTGIQIDE